ncbi:hypothetical protein LTR75_004399 [Friedmanniomyces endolithicus]|nr:hypothetical protein LTR75_004399 [Friedmanniomyces endolithicus]KAK0830672.1 hypothetical protein LTR03_015804 [Friedmanniomyces endolithicus]
MDYQVQELLPPGTVALEDLQRNEIILQPTPSDDPEQPLNWSVGRKTVNYVIVCFYALITFTLLDIGTVVWGPLNEELGISYNDMNNSFAANVAGLAIGCIFMVPLAVKFGRRPVYIASTAIQLAACIWSARTYTTGDLIGSNVVSGVGGAISESIVQMTIADLFFVHQRARMNSAYLVMVYTGTFLAPVAAGYCAKAQGWRWIWWWTLIFIAVSLVITIVAYEETKYTPRTDSMRTRSHDSYDQHDLPTKIDENSKTPLEPTTAQTHDTSFASASPKRSWKRRYALITRTPGGSRPFLHLVWDTVTLVRFPAVAYTALMWGATLMWFSVVLTTMSTYFTPPPYNFSPIGIGLMNLPPFIGTLLGLVVSSSNDWIILKLSKRNRGIFEPEMRLWLALLGAIITPAGVLLFGLSMTNGMPWIIPCIGNAMFGFGSAVNGGASLTYLQDCYAEVIGDALVSVTFVRNGLAAVVVFALTPWINSLGLYNTFVCASVLAWAVYLLTLPMLIWGRKWRVLTAASYRQHLARSGKHAPGTTAS